MSLFLCQALCVHSIAIIWLLLIPAIDAAAIFVNSTTTSSTTPTSSTTSYSSSSTSSLYCHVDNDGGYCSYSGEPEVQEYYVQSYNPYALLTFTDNLAPAALTASSCSVEWMNSLETFVMTAPVRLTTEGLYFSGVSSGMATIFATNQPIEVVQGSWGWTATTPCCLDCTLYGGRVQVYYWPDPPPATAVPFLVNSEGFTFTSPSVYVVFQSVYATDLCGIRSANSNITIGFPLNYLSTATGYFQSSMGDQPIPTDYMTGIDIDTSFTEATWADQTSCMDVTSEWASVYTVGIIQTGISEQARPGDTYSVGPPPESTTNTFPAGMLERRQAQVQETTSAPSLFQVYYYSTQFTWNPCSPILSIPTELYIYHAAWSTCGPGVYGFYDPPYALTPGSGLLPPLTPAADPGPIYNNNNNGPNNGIVTQNPPTATDAAAVGATPTLTIATKTDPPIPNTTPQYVPERPPTNDPPTKTPTANMQNGDPTGAQSSNDPASNDPLSVITIAGATITANSASAFPIGTQTLSVNGPAITISSIVYSLDAKSGLIISTISLSNYPAPVGDPPTTVPGKGALITSSISSSSPILEIIIEGQTLIEGGPAITVSGTVMSLETGGYTVVVGGKTEPVGELVGTSTTTGLGGIIASLGGFGETPTTSSTQTTGTQTAGFNGLIFTGNGHRTRREGNILVGALLFGAAIEIDMYILI